MSSFPIKKPIMGLYRAPEKHEYLNYGDRSETAIIDSIIVHYTVSDFPTSYTLLTADRGVSAHYLIREDGRIDNLVADEKKAWHAGVSNWRGKEGVNDFSIGIEIVNPGSGDQDCFPIRCESETIPNCEKHPFTEAQLNSLAELISYLKSIHPHIEDRNIIGHNDITAYAGRKIDPGVAFDWQYLASKGHSIYSNLTIELPKALYKIGDQAEQIKTLQHNLKLLGYNITENGHYDEHTANVARAFNLHFNQNTKNCWGSWDEVADLRLSDLLLHLENAAIAPVHDEL